MNSVRTKVLLYIKFESVEDSVDLLPRDHELLEEGSAISVARAAHGEC